MALQRLRKRNATGGARELSRLWHILARACALVVTRTPRRVEGVSSIIGAWKGLCARKHTKDLPSSRMYT